jgi:hypothetical protein
MANLTKNFFLTLFCLLSAEPMLEMSDVDSESVSADFRVGAAKTRLLSPCVSDRLAVLAVIVAFGAIISQDPAGQEYTV